MMCEVRGLKFEVRGLTLREIKELGAGGIDLGGMMKIGGQKERYAKMCTVVGMVVPALTLEDLTPAEMVELFFKINQLTILNLPAGEFREFVESRMNRTGK
jgi:hypothetical protein